MNDVPNIINLGAGKQSSTMSLMACAGEIMPMPMAAIFADTGSEPKSVYDWLFKFLKPELEKSFPVYIVSAGDLADAGLKMKVNQSGNKNHGKRYWRSMLPLHTIEGNGNKGMLMRKCTGDHKIKPLLKKVREVAKIKRGEKEISVIQWLGISLDEADRQKPATDAWAQHRYPLIELGMSRNDCDIWMKKNGYPVPPRSACYFCPYHSDAEWQRLKNEEEPDFQAAVDYEIELQTAQSACEVTRGKPFLHRSRIPLSEVDFMNNNSAQFDMFSEECSGNCGV